MRGKYDIKKKENILKKIKLVSSLMEMRAQLFC